MSSLKASESHTAAQILDPFHIYSTPPPHANFSSLYFQTLTVNQTVDLEYPTISPRHSVKSQEFDPVELQMTSATLITPGEVIPNILDLGPTIASMEEAYARGMRSVRITLLVNGTLVSKHYHFSKVQLIKLVNNYQDRVLGARKTLSHILSHLPDLGDALETFRTSGITTQMQGLYTHTFPLTQLSCLLSEDWLHEDVFNALIELCYFRYRHLSIHQASSAEDLTWLLLPTSFLTDTRTLYKLKPRGYSRELLNLRHRLSTSRIKGVAFSNIEHNHFTGYYFQIGDKNIVFGDSLRGSPSSDVVSLVNWVFSDLIPPLEGVISGDVARQGGRNRGQGSCGVAALNFIELAVNPQVRRWTGLESSIFRDSLLEDLIRYHHASVVDGREFGDWTQSMACPEHQLGQVILNQATGYNDFNVFDITLTTHHPVHCLIRNQTELSTHIRPSASLLSLPLLGDLNTCTINGSVTLAKRRSSYLESGSSTSETTRPVKRPKKLQVDIDHHDVIIISDDESDNGAEDMQLIKQEEFSGTGDSESATIIDLTYLSDSSADCIQVKVEPSANPANPRHPTCTVKEEMLSKPVSLQPGRSVIPSDSRVLVGSVFGRWEDAQAAIYQREEALGFQWKIAQSKTCASGQRKKVTFRCNRYYHWKPSHSIRLDPADHRCTKSIKTGCNAHVNVNRISNSNLWQVTHIDWTHNHPANNVNAPIQRRPTAAQKEMISRLATQPTQPFTRAQVSSMLKAQRSPGDPELELRQIGNIINTSRRQALDEIAELGGDFQAVISKLSELSREEYGWVYHIRLDQTGAVSALFWHSPQQGRLAKRYGDVLLNDNTYNRNRYGFPLDIGIIIDGHGRSRNIWYAVHAKEDIETHTWVLQKHLETVGYPPDTFISDRHATLIAVASSVFLLSTHIFCIHHLSGNVNNQVRLSLGAQWNDFQEKFWAAYRAVSPEHFDRLWKDLIEAFPIARSYLEEELYPCRTQWAWAWVSSQFTCGVRTNGRCEAENRTNKEIGNTKTSILKLFLGLNERAGIQGEQELIRVRDSSRQQHPSQIESLFPGPLLLLRSHAAPYALHTAFDQMKMSLYYSTEVIQRPPGIRSWTEYAIQVQNDIGFSWEKGEDKEFINTYKNDHSYISTNYFLRLITGRGQRVEHLLRVTHRGFNTSHILAILPHNDYACDCCMGRNIGIPCRHYFQALMTVKGLKFDLGKVLRARWYQNPGLNVSHIPAVSALDESTASQPPPETSPTQPLVTSRNHNTSSNNNRDSVLPTQTLPARTVFHEAHTAVGPLISKIQTREQLDNLLEHLEELRTQQQNENRLNQVRDPPAITHKGRPRTMRFTGANEGPPRGGGASGRLRHTSRDGRKCGHCRMPGHNRANCPGLHLL